MKDGTLVNMMIVLTACLAATLIICSQNGAFTEKPTQKERIEQLEQRCDSLQKQIDYMVE
jgi:predicted transcriptional regulator